MSLSSPLICQIFHFGTYSFNYGDLTLLVWYPSQCKVASKFPSNSRRVVFMSTNVIYFGAPKKFQFLRWDFVQFL